MGPAAHFFVVIMENILEKEGQIREIIESVIRELGLDLVDLKLQGRSGGRILRVFIDEPGGVSLQRCTLASRAISDILDQKDPLPDRYTLEVSSPGVDRPLKTERDFERNCGKKIRIRHQQADCGVDTTGIIDAVSQGVLYLKENNDNIEVKIDDIITAKILIEI